MERSACVILHLNNDIFSCASIWRAHSSSLTDCASLRSFFPPICHHCSSRNIRFGTMCVRHVHTGERDRERSGASKRKTASKCEERSKNAERINTLHFKCHDMERCIYYFIWWCVAGMFGYSNIGAHTAHNWWQNARQPGIVVKTWMWNGKSRNVSVILSDAAMRLRSRIHWCPSITWGNMIQHK